VVRTRTDADGDWKFRLQSSASYALSCWILLGAVIALGLFVGAAIVVAVDPELLTAVFWIFGAGVLVHLVLVGMLYRSLDGDLLLSTAEVSKLKRLVLSFGLLGALETFHALRRAARTEFKRREPHPALPLPASCQR
jgi:hypothetical protein